ncbi:MAG: twin-arginine translocation signal domain-containing protein [Candidatus Aminicenantales bacterium]
MAKCLNRREFIQFAAAGGAVCLAGPRLWPFAGRPQSSQLVSPGCRGTKVKVARLCMGIPQSHWPKPTLDLQKEIAFYRSEFARMKDEFADIDFVVDELVTSPAQVASFRERLSGVEGILVIHLSIGIGDILKTILEAGKPTMIFARPYSGHEWVHFGELRQQPLGARMDCLLTSDTDQLPVAVRPFRAIHHLREAKVMNLTTHDFSEYAGQVRSKFGTEIKPVGLDRMVAIYNGISDKDAKAEAERWTGGAVRVVEPSAGDIFRSAKLALAFEKLLDEEQATVMTVDCYGSMWDRTIKLPAYPCLGFARLNDMGLGGICESDLRSTMVHIIFQGLVGRPGFVSDPTVDESKGSIILAHCLGTPKMDGPAGPAAPYKIRTVMERQEGVVPQVEMRVGQKVTQAILIGMDTIRYFTGTIIEAPVELEHDRGCRTKIDVRVDGDIRRLWQNWTAGLHRQTVYGDITRELGFLARFKEIKLFNEAA